jgi:hypothetical protein
MHENLHLPEVVTKYVTNDVMLAAYAYHNILGVANQKKTEKADKTCRGVTRSTLKLPRLFPRAAIHDRNIFGIHRASEITFEKTVGSPLASLHQEGIIKTLNMYLLKTLQWKTTMVISPLKIPCPQLRSNTNEKQHPFTGLITSLWERFMSIDDGNSVLKATPTHTPIQTVLTPVQQARLGHKLANLGLYYLDQLVNCNGKPYKWNIISKN